MTNEYEHYLKSSEWKKKRLEKAKLVKYRCQICGKVVKSGFHIHHKTYKNIGNEKMGDLWFLCEECHNELHQYLKSENLSISGSTKQQKLFRRKMLRLNREPKKKNGKPTDNQIILYNNLCKKLGFIAKRLKTADEYRKAIGIMQRIRANEKGE